MAFSETIAPYINGCDSFPDGFLFWSWRHCCDVHDIAYSIGGESIDRINADMALAACIMEVGGPFGIMAGIGVLLFGWLFFRYTSLKGKNIWESVVSRGSKN